MRVYSADGELMAQYGETSYPTDLKSNSTRDGEGFYRHRGQPFYEHHGVDPVGIFRAASVALFSGHASQGQVLLLSSWRVTSSSARKRR